MKTIAELHEDAKQFEAQTCKAPGVSATEVLVDRERKEHAEAVAKLGKENIELRRDLLDIFTAGDWRTRVQIIATIRRKYEPLHEFAAQHGELTNE